MAGRDLCRLGPHWRRPACLARPRRRACGTGLARLRCRNSYRFAAPRGIRALSAFDRARRREFWRCQFRAPRRRLRPASHGCARSLAGGRVHPRCEGIYFETGARERGASRHRREWRSRCSTRRRTHRVSKIAAGPESALMAPSKDRRTHSMKLLRTNRLHPSDTFISPSAAQLGEWAVSGAFVFADVELATLEGKELAAFRSGFLGVPSLDWSTLVQVVEASAKDRLAAIDLAAQCLLDRFGAPDLVVAREAAAEEIDFTASLCDHPPDTLIAVHRKDEGGSFRETV